MRFYAYSAIRVFCCLRNSLLQLGSAIGILTLLLLHYCTSFGHTWQVVKSQDLSTWF